VPTIIELISQCIAPKLAAQASPSWAKVSLALDEIVTPLASFLEKVRAAPPSQGYEPLLVKHNWDPTLARMAAKLMVRSGQRVARDRQRLTPVVEAIRFLSRPKRRRRLVLTRVRLLLSAWEETSVIETLFAKAGIYEHEFIFVLKAMASFPNDSGTERLSQLAASIMPHLPRRTGRAITASSAAHEFLLKNLGPNISAGAYTWNAINEDFTDTSTIATRREFKEPHFDPRPAARRMKKSRLVRSQRPARFSMS
jgi:hypothetical protein